MSLPQATAPPLCCPSSTEDLRRLLHERLNQIIDFVLTQSDHFSFLDFEKRLLALLASLGQLLMQLFLLVRHQRLDYTSWLDKGYRLADDFAERTLQTAFGAVRYGRAYLIPKKGSGPGVHPLDAELGLGRDSYSPLLIGWFCRLATRLSFRLASEMGGMFLCAAPSPSTIEEWSLGLARPAYIYLSQGPLPEGDGEVLVIECDGKAIPTATEQELAKRRGPRPRHAKACACGCQRHRRREHRKQSGGKKKRKKGDKSKNGKSAVLVVMYTLERGKDGRLHGPINKKVYGTFSSRKVALRWAREQATRRGFPPETPKTVQIILDGELCLEQQMRKLFPKATLTLDIRHAQEKLWQVGRLFHAEGSTELAAWVEPLEALLYQGQIDELLERLAGQWRAVAKHGPGTRAKRETLRKVYWYLRKRVKLMAYGHWREEDLVIASGVVEGAARYVVGERLDNSGMRWIKQRAEAVLLLRCIEVNGDWDSFWDWAQKQRSEALCNGKVVQIRSKTPTQIPRAA
jgi:hypothetical protein